MIQNDSWIGRFCIKVGSKSTRRRLYPVRNMSSHRHYIAVSGKSDLVIRLSTCERPQLSQNRRTIYISCPVKDIIDDKKKLKSTVLRQYRPVPELHNVLD